MILFVAGIDTGVGKTVATGLMARWHREQGRTTITQKLVQTGGEGLSEDIRTHRRLMGVDLLAEDQSGLTCPCVLRFPSSPHLAAALEGRQVDVEAIRGAAHQLARRYDVVLVEGAGGLCVPLTENLLAIDFVKQEGWPVVLVTTSKLGSINHTLLSLEALKTRGIGLAAVIYNLHFPASPEIVEDTRRVIVSAVREFGSDTPVIDLPLDAGETPDLWSPSGRPLST